jgi:ribosomal protein S18 acetylase RimI-like enzyme
MSYDYRPLTVEDEPALWLMLMHASHEKSPESVRANPDLARYVNGWGRPGDSGFLAVSDGEPVGAIWMRLWPDDDRGFGYIDAATPELAMAVLPAHRGSGVGVQLLNRLLEAASHQYRVISLNVRIDNPAVRLYQRSGFSRVEGTQIANRAGGISFTMVKKFGG